MDTKRWMVAVAATAVLGGCATTQPSTKTPTVAPAPVETPASALVDHAGDSIETAIAVPADAPEEGFRFQNDWIYDHFGTFRRLGGGTGNAAGRRYDVVDIELKNGEKHKVFFDITENWNRWTPPK
ncbi:MAG TPA: hypothetical protein VGJ81_16275 [Thermoanaerobaculia bacterium]